MTLRVRKEIPRTIFRQDLREHWSGKHSGMMMEHCLDLILFLKKIQQAIKIRLFCPVKKRIMLMHIITKLSPSIQVNEGYCMKYFLSNRYNYLHIMLF